LIFFELIFDAATYYYLLAPAHLRRRDAATLCLRFSSIDATPRFAAIASEARLIYYYCHADARYYHYASMPLLRCCCCQQSAMMPYAYADI